MKKLNLELFVFLNFDYKQLNIKIVWRVFSLHAWLFTNTNDIYQQKNLSHMKMQIYLLWVHNKVSLW